MAFTMPGEKHTAQAQAKAQTHATGSVDHTAPNPSHLTKHSLNDAPRLALLLVEVLSLAGEVPLSHVIIDDLDLVHPETVGLHI
jgi:hypothetical protein